MTEILEYFLNNYTLFLGGAIVILLAIIGYYADKTNFGQGTNTENKENSTVNIDINNVGLMDISKKMNGESTTAVVENKTANVQNVGAVLELHQNSVGNEIKPKEEIKYQEDNSNHMLSNNLSDNNSVDIMNLEMPKINSESKEQSVMSELIEPSGKNVSNSLSEELGKIKNDILLNVAKQQGEYFKRSDEDIKKFDEEFNSVLPQTELINSDLLNEIDDLELGKTQKLNLSDLTKLDDISLPRISNSVKEEREIWKF